MCDILIRNEHVINGLDLDTPIYKYIPLRHLLSMFINRNLCYRKTYTWEDSYENYFLNQDFMMCDGQIIKASRLTKGIFGMCWTTMAESDAMWRIYSNYGLINELQGSSNSLFLKHTAVRVKTTARKLFDATYRSDDDCSHVYIGKVEYISKDNINERMKQMQPINHLDLNHAWVKSMFIKRTEFEHEHEIRSIISYTPDDERSFMENLFFEIEPHDFIEEITLDPRLNTTDEHYATEKIIEVGANPDIIYKSELYAFESQTLQLA